MIEYKKIDRTHFPHYDLIPMRFCVSSYYRIDKLNNGLGGFSLVETPVEPYLKDFCTGDDESVSRWEKRWDISNWAFFMAFYGERPSSFSPIGENGSSSRRYLPVPVGGVTAASRTKGVNMLDQRDDLAVLWDLRVDEEYKHKGIGQTLFNMLQRAGI